MKQTVARVSYVGGTPSSAPDPLVRLCHHTRSEGGASAAVRGDGPTKRLS